MFKKISNNFLIQIARTKMFFMDSKTFFSRFLDGSAPFKTCHVNRTNGGHSKVTSLQTLLRKAFRSPVDIFLGDFGIFCLIVSCASRKKNNSSWTHLHSVTHDEPNPTRGSVPTRMNPDTFLLPSVWFSFILLCSIFILISI